MQTLQQRTQVTITLRAVPAMTKQQANAFAALYPMRAAAARANVLYVLAEMEATDEQRSWCPLK